MNAGGPRPLQIQREGSDLVVQWDDDHQSTYQPRRLRLACPCAACRKERDGGVRPPDSLPAESFRLDRWQWTGNYALTLAWGDGHCAGIYSWPVLRDLCDCFACRLERREIS